MSEFDKKNVELNEIKKEYDRISAQLENVTALKIICIVVMIVSFICRELSTAALFGWMRIPSGILIWICIGVLIFIYIMKKKLNKNYKEIELMYYTKKNELDILKNEMNYLGR